VYEEPEWFLREVVGLKPWEMEDALVRSVRDNLRTLVAGCVASGKTHATAGLVLWFLVAFGPVARVFAIAPSERQLKVNLFGEISRMHERSTYPLGGEMQTLNLKMGTNWFAIGFSPKEAANVFGMHGEADLFLLDDAQGIEQPIWEGLENAMASGTTRLLASCNPVVVSGEIHDVLSHRGRGFNVIQVTADEHDPRLGSPNVFLAPNVAAGRVVVPGTITSEMVAHWFSKFGYDSDFCRTKVRCLLPKQEPDTLIPLDWIEKAMVREVPEEWYCRACETVYQDTKQAKAHERESSHVVVPHTYLGVDVARFGDDRSARVPIRGRRVMEPRTTHGNDTMQVAGLVAMDAKELSPVQINVDSIGLGAGVADRLRELDLPAYDVNVGESANAPEKFERLRDEIWWNLRESLNPGNPNALALPRDNDLAGDLSAPKWTTISSGKIKVESKDSLKKRLGRSPDVGDACCLAAWRGGSLPGVMVL
jgi:phage terminase large subunit